MMPTKHAGLAHSIGKRIRPALLLALAVSVSLVAAAQADTMRHGSSLFDNLKYADGFKKFDYVNPDAPKDGEVVIAAIGGFDSFNGFVVTGQPPAGLGFIYDTLMTGSMDEAGSEYGLIAESLSYPDDYSSVTYKLRPQARFADGQPITAEDVIWTFETLKTNHPFYGAYYANVVKAEALDAHTVKFSFSEKNNRELPQIVGQLPILPKHYWTDKDAKGRPRDISKTTLEVPLGNGAYRIKTFTPGRSITYERDENYWAKDLPVNMGANNFQTLRYEYFKDPTIAFEAFKAHQVDFWRETSAKNWATAYDIPPVKDGRITKEELSTKNNEGMQAFAFNLRRAKFADPRVREAFDWAFDFGWMNKNIFYGAYMRSDSYFANSELASTSVPGGLELSILEPFKDQLPPALFTQAYVTPTTDGSGTNRGNLRKAIALMKEAGWSVKDGILTNDKTGEPFTVEFMLDNPAFERVVAPYIQSLKRIGIQATLRTIDTAQYQNRLDKRDFDMVVASFGQSMSPGNEQRGFWGCAAAKEDGSRNVMGICDPVVEKLIDRVIYATSREELVAATHALDRVLLWHHYLVPNWYSPYERVAYWSGIARPAKTPDYSIGFPSIWWHNPKGETAKPSEQ